MYIKNIWHDSNQKQPINTSSCRNDHLKIIKRHNDLNGIWKKCDGLICVSCCINARYINCLKHFSCCSSLVRRCRINRERGYSFTFLTATVTRKTENCGLTILKQTASKDIFFFRKCRFINLTDFGFHWKISLLYEEHGVHIQVYPLTNISLWFINIKMKLRMDWNGECVKEATTPPKSRQRPKATYGSWTQRENTAPGGVLQLAPT